MEEINHTTVTEFILAGLTENPELQLPLFFIFLALYVVTVVGNLGMIVLILFSSQLHTPMYYLLSSLSFIDCCQSTVITPKMLVNFVTERNVITYPECIAQFYFFCVFAVSECHMLSVMAYDRYIAIANPLLYNVAMSHQVCSLMIAGVYGIGLLSATAHTVFLIRVFFCKADLIKHYFCDLFPLLQISCSNTFINELVALSLSAFNIVVPAMMILSSYIFIIVSILRIQSTGGRAKAFSTCSSHILAVAIFYGSTAFMYLQPSSVSSIDQGKVSSVFYTTVVPMLNPLIYSLRNKDVKAALKSYYKDKFLQNKEYISLEIEYNFFSLEEDTVHWKPLVTLNMRLLLVHFYLEEIYQKVNADSDFHTHREPLHSRCNQNTCIGSNLFHMNILQSGLLVTLTYTNPDLLL